MKSTIKTVVKVIAVLLILSGSVWALQGFNLLPGTFMRGDPQWIINGVVTVVVGAGLYWFVSRKN